MFAIGYGLWDDLILFKNVSIGVAMASSITESGRLLLVPSVGGGLTIPAINWLKALRLEEGIAIRLESGRDKTGGMFAIGLDSRVFPLRFTNAGITCRLKYQWFYLDRTRHGPCFELILH